MSYRSQGTTGAVRVGVMLLAAGLTFSAPSASAQGSDAYRLDGARVAVYNIAGSIEIVRGSGSQVVVHVTTLGSEGGRLRVEVGEVRGREALRVIYPEDRIVYPEMGRGSRTNVQVRPDGTFSDGGGRGGDRFEIRGSGRGVEAYADIRVEVPAGRSLEAYVAVGEASARGIDGDLLIDTGSGSVDVADVRGTLSIDTGSGSVTVRGVEGSASVDTGSGRVRIEDVRGDRILVDTGSGGVSGSDLIASSVHVDTGSGGIKLEGVDSPDVYLDTGSGSVEVWLMSDVERLEIDTGSGSVTVYAPSDLGAELEIDSGSGGIDLDFEIEVRTMRRNHIEGSLGDGRGSIRIDTGSGSIRLRRN